MEEIQGTVEEIVFKNDENGYVVAKISEDKKNTTIVGCIPYIIEGQMLKLGGKWMTHPKFGEQFKVESCEEIVPNSVIGIERYLSSGLISGIGPVTAKKIVEKFKEKTLEILQDDIYRLSEIEGIGKKKIELIRKSYSKQKEMQNIMVFLQTYGVTPNQCAKIYKRYGANSIEAVKKNPYILTEEISGIGFKIADKIARSLGIENNSPFRLASGVRYVINQFCALGNTYMPLDELLKQASEILCVKTDEIEESVVESTLNMKLKVEEINKEKSVFTMPYYYSEIAVTHKIVTLATETYDKVKVDIEEEIGNFEKENNIEFADSQKEAIVGAINNGIEIITGGPGTGKTTIINCITHIFEKASMNVFMAAPTGRAAKRMSESTGKEAKTIHRLLELGISDENEAFKFSRGEEEPLQCDVLILDEASMIDIMLMNSLLKAIAMGTRVIIVGDVDQLPSVGPGNVLKDLIESNCVKVVRLKEIFRQAKESMIIVNAHMINSGEMPILNKKNKDFYFIRNEDKNKICDEIIGLIDKRLPKFNEKWNKFKNIQILSPMRRGTLGIENLNNKLQDVLNPHHNLKKEIEYRNIIYRVGDKVMQIKNNYMIEWRRISGSGDAKGKGVFNGDVGYIKDIDEENGKLIVVFDEEKEVEYENSFLDELDLAYAITIHKSQGSEFPVVIMPVFMGTPFLMNRNLLYTAITRAKQLVVIVGSLKALNFMVKNDRTFERYSSLEYRIKEIINENDEE